MEAPRGCLASARHPGGRAAAGAGAGAAATIFAFLFDFGAAGASAGAGATSGFALLPDFGAAAARAAGSAAAGASTGMGVTQLDSAGLDSSTGTYIPLISSQRMPLGGRPGGRRPGSGTSTGMGVTRRGPGVVPNVCRAAAPNVLISIGSRMFASSAGAWIMDPAAKRNHGWQQYCWLEARAGTASHLPKCPHLHRNLASGQGTAGCRPSDAQRAAVGRTATRRSKQWHATKEGAGSSAHQCLHTIDVSEPVSMQRPTAMRRGPRSLGRWLITRSATLSVLGLSSPPIRRRSCRRLLRRLLVAHRRLKLAAQIRRVAR